MLWKINCICMYTVIDIDFLKYCVTYSVFLHMCISLFACVWKMQVCVRVCVHVCMCVCVCARTCVDTDVASLFSCKCSTALFLLFAGKAIIFQISQT